MGNRISGRASPRTSWKITLFKSIQFIYSDRLRTDDVKLVPRKNGKASLILFSYLYNLMKMLSVNWVRRDIRDVELTCPTIQQCNLRHSHAKRYGVAAQASSSQLVEG
jgi:hypothetical protein